MFYPAKTEHENTFSYLVVDPIKRTATVFYHNFGASEFEWYIIHVPELGIDYRTTDMMQMLPNLSDMEVLHFRVSRKNVQISGPKNHENLRINS